MNWIILTLLSLSLIAFNMSVLIWLDRRQFKRRETAKVNKRLRLYCGKL